MDEKRIPEDIKRFILNILPSVPHGEALLLMHTEFQQVWDVPTLAQRLFTTESKIQEILSELTESGFLSVRKDDVTLYLYSPISQRHREIADRVTAISDFLIRVECPMALCKKRHLGAGQAKSGRMPLPQGAILDSIIFATCAWCGSGSLNLCEKSDRRHQSRSFQRTIEDIDAVID